LGQEHYLQSIYKFIELFATFFILNAFWSDSMYKEFDLNTTANIINIK